MEWKDKTRQNIFVIFICLCIVVLAATSIQARHQNEDYAQAYQQYLMGVSSLRSGEYAQGIKILSQLPPGFNDSFQVLSLLGQAHLHLGQYPEAIRLLKKAEQANPPFLEDARHLYTLGKAYYLDNQIDAARLYLTQAQLFTNDEKLTQDITELLTLTERSTAADGTTTAQSN